VVTATFLIPLLSVMMTGQVKDLFRKVRLPASTDIVGKSGVEEFIPALVNPDGGVSPLWARSGYILALGRSDGLLRLPEDVETLRKGKEVEVWLW
jgi:molybdopterin biosynthesis enzyme